MQGIVFGCVLLTLLLQGGTAELLVRWLGLAVASRSPATREKTPLPDGSGRGSKCAMVGSAYSPPGVTSTTGFCQSSPVASSSMPSSAAAGRSVR